LGGSRKKWEMTIVDAAKEADDYWTTKK